MAHFLRGKQAGIQNDFSERLTPDLYALDDLRRIGVSSQVSELAYDPVQSILAVGTKSTQFGPGQIYVFGGGRISVTFSLSNPKASVKILRFCSDRLLCLDDRNDLNIYNLPDKKHVAGYSPAGVVTALASDPTLDYAIIGLSNGEILAYDIDREAIAPFRLPCFWKQQFPRSRTFGIVTLEFHPRDIGKLLIGYAEGAAAYSFKQNAVQQFYHYQIPPGAPGGDGDPSSSGTGRAPRLTQATWHPTGTFILTGHEDSSLVVWDPKDARVILARTLTDTHVDHPATTFGSQISDRGQFMAKAPLVKIVWCANQDPDDTALLVAGGMSMSSPTKGMTLFELGRTPNYATSTWQVLADHFVNPKRQRVLPTPPMVEVVNFCMIPRKSPWFAGAQDPVALIALLSTGELTTMSFPSGFPISPTNQLHLSLTFVHPFINTMSYDTIDRNRWLGMTERRSSGPKILRGGAEATKPLKRFETRNIICTAHADGTIRLWDVGHADEIENEQLLQVDVPRAVGRFDDVAVTKMSFSGASGELAVGLKSGEVSVFRWAKNSRPGQEPPASGPNSAQALTSITDRKDPSLVEGFHPFTLLDQQNGAVTAVKVSDVGFIAAGFEGGSVVVIDMRGPAIIFTSGLGELGHHKDKSKSFRRKSEPSGPDFITSLVFSVMTLEHDNYSSILLHAGTKKGQVHTFKILPGQGGRYSVEYAGASSLTDEIRMLHPINASNGSPALATQAAVGGLRNGEMVDGAVMAVSKTEARLFKPATSKGAHKSWDAGFCDSAAVVRALDHGYALVALFGDGTARAYSIPALSQIASIDLSNKIDVKRFSEAIITNSGEILAWTGPSELAFLSLWGTGESLPIAQDRIFNPETMLPPRPTISNFQWISGSQYISPSDMDILIGGPDRPPSKRQIAQARSDEKQRLADARSSAKAGAASTSQGGEPEGWGAYMTRQLNERTERLNIMGDSMNNLEDNSQGWADDVNKFVSRQKRNFVMGAVKGKFGF